MSDLEKWRDWANDVCMVAHTVVPDDALRQTIGAQAIAYHKLELAAKGVGKGDQRDEYIHKLAQQLHAAEQRILKLTSSNERLAKSVGQLTEQLAIEREREPVQVVTSQSPLIFDSTEEAIEYMQAGGVITYGDGSVERRISLGAPQRKELDGEWTLSDLAGLSEMDGFYRSVKP